MRLIGMVHLAPLPGAPRHSGGLDAVVRDALTDAVALTEGGCDALMVENFGDTPYFPDDVPNVTVASMTRVVSTVVETVDLPVGVNVLRNDALAALAVAAAAGASFIRVNVLSGSMTTDQGPITGRAAEVARARATWAPGIDVFADVFVKHAVPPPGLAIEDATADLVLRAGADAVVVSGTATGFAPAADRVAAVARASAGAPVYIGSGLDPRNAATLLKHASGAIVGTTVKLDGVAANPVDPARLAELVAAVAETV